LDRVPHEGMRRVDIAHLGGQDCFDDATCRTLLNGVGMQVLLDCVVFCADSDHGDVSADNAPNRM